MNSQQTRQAFFDFFNDKKHKIVASAPIVVKNDPTLMFTNAGMNQFKDFFLGNKKIEIPRVADSQKCLRVSGKHNDLEEVGIDSYHHTMFEMLGNWSFGDYFKKEAIAWGWELLTEVYKLDKDRLYVSVFGGDDNEGLGSDEEAKGYWKSHIDDDRILYFDKKDNFWEMGDVGPCGPCSEIHIDLRSEEDRKKIDGASLVNEDHPLVIEIWNLVFIQFNRKSDGTLEPLDDKHIDTGMGFERLCMAVQGKTSNYSTDIFMPTIRKIESASGIKYNDNYDSEAKTDIAMRVIADHLRAVSFTIADGEMPSNTGAGYVIRRILRRAVRYYYSFLNINEAFLHTLVPTLADMFEDVFPELKSQEKFVTNVILEEEKSFLRTLSEGLKRIEKIDVIDNKMSGKQAFELYDTYGFPLDLTMLIASEKSWSIDEEGFKVAMQEQKDRARASSVRSTGDWNEIIQTKELEFIGYDHTEYSHAKLVKYRTVEEKGKSIYQIVLDKTPFYAESGGQVGDTGYLEFGHEKIKVINTQKENDLIIHFVDKFPKEFDHIIHCQVDEERRALIVNNHSATHLLHAALQHVVGSHVHQKGSLVQAKNLRFDYSHFQKLSDEEIRNIEEIVNAKIRENIPLEEHRSIPISEAKSAGAMMLFGEKYGDYVRMITFDPEYSRELCGGCHVASTGSIGQFKIVSESSIAAGVRRIEAVTAGVAEAYINGQLDELSTIKKLFKNPVHTVKNIEDTLEENKLLRKELDSYKVKQAGNLKSELLDKIVNKDGINILIEELPLDDSKSVKTLAFNIEKEIQNTIIGFGFISNGKPQILILIDKDIANNNGVNAGSLIREVAKEINGGGGGQPHFATAGGSKAEGLKAAMEKLRDMV